MNMRINMDTNWIYGPILIIVMHIFALLIYAASKRIIAVKKKQLDYKVVQNLDYRAMPEDILLAGRSYDNQFQQPILFIDLLGFIASNAIQDTTWILAAWLYVLLRLWHSIEHLKAHNLKRRTYAFGLSSLLLLFMWLAFLVSRLV